jgi:hypothetical protein
MEFFAQQLFGPIHHRSSGVYRAREKSFGFEGFISVYFAGWQKQTNMRKPSNGSFGAKASSTFVSCSRKKMQHFDL